MRYVDLVVNEGVKDTFIARSKIIKAIRDNLTLKVEEVDTPVLQNILVELPHVHSSRTTNSDIPLYLRIANELYLKRLIVGGFEGVYEFRETSEMKVWTELTIQNSR